MARWYVLVSIDIGQPLRFSTDTIHVTRADSSDVLNFVGGLLEVSPPVLGDVAANCSFTIPRNLLDVTALRAQGVRLGGAPATVDLWREGDDYSLRIPLLVGVIAPSSEHRDIDRTSFEIIANESAIDPPFPPYQMLRTSPAFANMSESETGKTMIVAYGNLCRDVPLTPLRKGFTPTDTSIRLLVSGMRLGASSIAVRPNGSVALQWRGTVAYQPDPMSGAEYAYVDAQASQDGNIGASSFVADIVGHSGLTGSPITALGDMLVHALLTYGNFPADRIDMDRISRAVAMLNGFDIASVFGGTPGTTLIQTLQGRFHGNFPVEIGWLGGRIGFDYLGWDDSAPAIQNLRIGVPGAELLGRVGTTSLGPDTLYSSFAVQYDRDTVGKRFRSVITADPSNSELCARSASRWGSVVKYQTLQVPDTNSEQGARAILEWLVSEHAVQRTTMRYVAALDTVAKLPRMEPYLITDAEFGFSAERFKLTTIAPRLDGLAELTFVSFGEAP